MKFYIGITDTNWFNFLRDNNADEMNFWRPSAKLAFRALEPGELFLWKLHAPNNFIVGGGFFVRFSVLPLSLAWDVFGQKNGAATFQEFSSNIRRYIKSDEFDPRIGCVALTSPFYLPRDRWISIGSEFPTGIVQGKGFDTNDSTGQRIWEQVQEALTSIEGQSSLISIGATEAARFGQPRMITPRLGQGGFRVSVTEAYNHCCAMTGEKTLPVLEAAHIRPFASQGPHLASNGLLLRADLHTLFDRGFITITSEKRIEVSSQIRETYGNGRHYYALHGQKLQVLPKAIEDQPADEFIDWHNQNVFQI